LKRRSLLKGILFAAMMPIASAFGVDKIKIKSSEPKRFELIDPTSGTLRYVGPESITVEIKYATEARRFKVEAKAGDLISFNDLMSGKIGEEIK